MMQNDNKDNIITYRKIAIFIDGWNLSSVCREFLKKDIDFKKLLSYFSQQAYILRAFYYIGEEIEAEEKKNQLKFLDWLRMNGYKVVTRPIKVYLNDDGKKEKKADFDVDIAIDMFEIAEKIDKIVLFSGDGDFTKLIDRIGMKGVRTQVVAYWGKEKVLRPTSSELIKTADEFTDLVNIIDNFQKI